MAPQLEGTRESGTFPGGRVALLRDHGGVEAGMTRPGPEHAVVELQAVHLGANQVPVHLLGHRPAPRIDRLQPAPEVVETRLLRGHGGRRVVRHPVHDPGLLELSPLREQGQEVLVPLARRRRLGRRDGGQTEEDGEHQPHENASRNGRHATTGGDRRPWPSRDRLLRSSLDEEEPHAERCASAPCPWARRTRSPCRACAPRAPRTSTPPWSRPRPSARPAATSSAWRWTAPRTWRPWPRSAARRRPTWWSTCRRTTAWPRRWRPTWTRSATTPATSTTTRRTSRSREKVRFLADVAREHDCAIRVGVNCGSVDPEHQGPPSRRRRGGHGGVGARALPRCSTTSASTATW